MVELWERTGASAEHSARIEPYIEERDYRFLVTRLHQLHNSQNRASEVQDVTWAIPTCKVLLYDCAGQFDARHPYSFSKPSTKAKPNSFQSALRAAENLLSVAQGAAARQRTIDNCEPEAALRNTVGRRLPIGHLLRVQAREVQGGALHWRNAPLVLQMAPSPWPTSCWGRSLGTS
jgi:hypothetical protein